MAEKKRRQKILIADREHGLPYSKGLTASSLMVTGLSPALAYSVANRVEDELIKAGMDRIDDEQLRDLTIGILREEAGDEHADAFIKWQSVVELDVPLIVLICGATGVGKSTIATQLAGRLGITRVFSTDAVREVLRSAFTEQMFPTLYASSFEAGEAVRQPIPHSGDRLIIGFREQAAAVAVGAQALIDRAVAEGTDMILEGAHLVPGFLQSLDTSNAVIVPLLLTVEDEELHRSHFYMRKQDTRPMERYLANFKKIRRLQKYMVSSALMRGVPAISHYDLDTTLTQIIDHILTTVLEKEEIRQHPRERGGKSLELAADAMRGREGDGTQGIEDEAAARTAGDNEGSSREAVP